MEEIEFPIESVQEQVHHATHGSGHSPGLSADNWISKIALFSALIAVLAAIAGLLAGHHSNEAMIMQIKSSDQWSFYQAKGIKSTVLTAKNDLLIQLGKSTSDSDTEKSNAYKEEQEKIQEKAREYEAESSEHLKIHEILARAVTLFQVSIAIAAIAVLTKKRNFFFISLITSLIALVFFIQALAT